jgi:endonuclease YncB( thermonuclease family)
MGPPVSTPAEIPTIAQTKDSAPLLSEPVATNVGKAPVKLSEATSFAMQSDGSFVASAPPKITKADLGKPEQVISAAPGAVPDNSRKVVATFVTATATKVKDGDGAIMQAKDPKNSPYGPVWECRLGVADAPEISHGPKRAGQPYGEAAMRSLQDLILNKEVNVSVSRKDQHGRSVCQIEIQGKDVSLEQIKSGSAWVYDYFAGSDPKYPQLKAAESAARNQRVGLWGASDNPVAPWKHRLTWPKN